MKNQPFFSFLLLLALSILSVDLPAFGQNPTISLEQALKLAMEKNHSVTISRNNAEIAANNAHPGQAGLLPTLAVSGGITKTSNNTDLEFAGAQPPVSASGAESTTKNANIQFQYVLRDGLGNLYRLNQLKANSSQTAAQTRQAIENTLVQVVSAYLAAVASLDALDVAKEALETSVTRYQRVEKRTGLGAGSNLELLSAEVDLNSDSSAVATSTINVENAVRSLAFLTGTPLSEAPFPQRDIPFGPLIDAAEVMQRALDQNPAIIAARHAVSSSDWFAKAATAAFIPTLSLSATYGFTNVQNEVGLILVQQNAGLSGNVTVSWNLFDGMRREINRKNARIQRENALENDALVREQLARDVSNIHGTYRNSLFLITKEEKNLQTARQNLKRAEESFSLGQITSTQLREAQLNVSRTTLRLNATKYTAKTAEIELLRLSGQLLESIK